MLDGQVTVGACVSAGAQAAVLAVIALAIVYRARFKSLIASLL